MNEAYEIIDPGYHKDRGTVLRAHCEVVFENFFIYLLSAKMISRLWFNLPALFFSRFVKKKGSLKAEFLIELLYDI